MPFHLNWRLERHPMLVHFPIALLCVALLLDVHAGFAQGEVGTP